MKPFLLASLLPVAALGQTPEPPLRDLLRDGLYAEEVTNDPAAAAKTYEQILARFEEQRPFAANALYRLAEVRSKEQRKEEAIALYQRVLTQFPDATPQAALSRTQLAALGAKPLDPSTPALPDDPEMAELHRFEKLAVSSPDLVGSSATLALSVNAGWVRPIAFALDHGAASNPETMQSLISNACQYGHLDVLKLVFAKGGDPHSYAAAAGLQQACETHYFEVAKALLDAGVSPDGKVNGKTPEKTTPLLTAIVNGDLPMLRLLISKGADVNLMPLPPTSGGALVGGPLHRAVFDGNLEIIDLLLGHKATIDLFQVPNHITPLWIAAGKEDGAPLVKKLLDLGADPESPSVSSADWTFKPWTKLAGPSTPLDQAVYTGSSESVRLLLAAIKNKGPERKPAFPSQLFIGPKSYAGTNPAEDTPVPSLEKLQLLFDAGAVAGPELLRRAAAIRESNGEDRIAAIVTLFLDHGTPVDPDWQRSHFNGTSTEKVLWLLHHRLNYPTWTAGPSIHLVNASGYSFTLVTREEGEKEPPSLEALLLAAPTIFGQYFPHLALMRKSEAGITERSVIDLRADEPFPALQWGDVLEMRHTAEETSAALRNQPGNWSDDVLEKMTKRVDPEILPRLSKRMAPPSAAIYQPGVPRPRVIVQPPGR